MKKLIAMAVGMSILALVPATQAGTGKTYTSHNCTSQKVEPRQIMFACGDGGYYVDHLDWSSWRTYRARSEGIFHKNDCDPNCAGGTFHSRHGKLILRKRMWCEDVGKYFFRRARVVYNKPLLGEDEESFRLFCPL
jgi:hypothetical protein